MTSFASIPISTLRSPCPLTFMESSPNRRKPDSAIAERTKCSQADFVSKRKSKESRKAVDSAVVGRRSQTKGKVAGFQDNQIRGGGEARGNTGSFKRRSNHWQAHAYVC